MIGTSKQVKWAVDIRDKKIKQIEANFQDLGWFEVEKLFIINKFLKAQEDAGWWIDNQGVSYYSLIIWAASHIGLYLHNRKLISNNADIIYPFPILNTSLPDGENPDIPDIEEQINFLQPVLTSWIAVVDNKTVITPESEIVDWFIVEKNDLHSLEEYNFYLSRYQPKKSNFESYRSIYKFLCQQDGGWRQKGWQFLIICRHSNGELQIEAISGDLIAKFSLIHELFQ